MYAGNKTQVQVLIHLSSSSALFVETKLPHCTWTWEFSLADLLARPQNPHTLLLSAGVVEAKIWGWKAFMIT